MQVRSLDTAVHVIFVFLLYALATASRIPSANKFWIQVSYCPFPLIYFYYIHMCPEGNTAIHWEEITLLAVRHVTVFFSLDHCCVESWQRIIFQKSNNAHVHVFYWSNIRLLAFQELTMRNTPDLSCYSCMKINIRSSWKQCHECKYQWMSCNIVTERATDGFCFISEKKNKSCIFFVTLCI